MASRVRTVVGLVGAKIVLKMEPFFFQGSRSGISTWMLSLFIGYYWLQAAQAIGIVVSVSIYVRV